MSLDIAECYRRIQENKARESVFNALRFTLATDADDDFACIEPLMQEVGKEKVTSRNKRPERYIEDPVILHVNPGSLSKYQYDSQKNKVVVDLVQAELASGFRIRRAEGIGRKIMIEDGDKRLAFVWDSRRKAWVTDAASLATLVPRSGRSALAGKSMGRGPDRHVER